MHRCPCCGKTWTLTQAQYTSININPNHVVGCCRSCSAKLASYLKDFGFKNPEMRKKQGEYYLKVNGTRSPFGSKEVQDKARAHWINDPNNGTNSPFGNKEVQEKSQNTMIKRHGTYSYLLSEEFLEKQLNRGASANAMRIANILEKEGFSVSLEVLIAQYRVDMQIDGTNILIEVNPTVTHNSNIGFKDMLPLPKYHHYNRTKTLQDLGYRLLNVWDWDKDNEIVTICKQMASNVALRLEQASIPVGHICHKYSGEHFLLLDIKNVKSYYDNKYMLVWDAGQVCLKHLLTFKL